LTEGAQVLVATSDERLFEAIHPSLESLGLEAVCLLVSEAVPPEVGAAALVDVRGLDADALDAALEPYPGSTRLVVLVSSAEAVPSFVESGVHDFVCEGDDPQVMALRLWMASRPAPGPRLSPEVRRLVRHDIRNPLAVILGQCEILTIELGGPLTDHHHRSVDAVDRQTEHLRGLVDRLADLLDDYW
jgi:hypothetical protein